MNKEKLILGTVQFGLKYGVNNSSGKPSEESVFEILDQAHRIGIEILDTADGYGESAEIISRYLSLYPGRFKIISKFVTPTPGVLRELLSNSLNRLRVNSLYGYLFHRFSDYLSIGPDSLTHLKTIGSVEKIGVSLYSLDQLHLALMDPAIDIIQLPFNILDSSEEKIRLMQKAKSFGKEIHVRSIFLQGLFFMEPNRLPGNLSGLSSVLRDIQDVQHRNHMSMEELCLCYAHSFKFIDHLVIGVENKKQLIRNKLNIKDTLREPVMFELQNISKRLSNPDLLNPSTWKLHD